MSDVDLGVVDVISRLRAHGLLEIVEATARDHHTTTFAICGRGRQRTVSAARQSAWTRIRALGLSLPEIGALFGRDHTTVLHGLRKARLSATAKLAGKRVA